MTRFEFSYDASPDLDAAALRCLLWKRGKVVGPLALVLIPILILLLAADPAWHSAAAILGGAALMLLVLVLVAVSARRRAKRRYLEKAANPQVRVVFDERGISVATAVGESFLEWKTIERVWRCEQVALVFYSGRNYIAVPALAAPPGSLDFAERQAGGTDTRGGPR